MFRQESMRMEVEGTLEASEASWNQDIRTNAGSCVVTRDNSRLDNLCRGLCGCLLSLLLRCVWISPCGCRSEGLNNSRNSPCGQVSRFARARHSMDDPAVPAVWSRLVVNIFIFCHWNCLLHCLVWPLGFVPFLAFLFLFLIGVLIGAVSVVIFRDQRTRR